MFITTAGGGMIASSVLGGLLGGGSSSKGQTTTQTQSLDPRMQEYVYGGNGKTGILPYASSLFAQQAANGGLNDMQRQGLNTQYNYLTSPAFTQGYDQMRSLGSTLMGAGVAGNPFTGGGRSYGLMSAPQTPQVSYQSLPSLLSTTSALPNYGGAYQAPATPAPVDTSQIDQLAKQLQPYFQAAYVDHER